MAYFLTVAGQQKGPHDKDEIRSLISEGTVSLDDLVWVAERNRWLQIKFYPEIASLFQEIAKKHKEISEEHIINVDGTTGGPFPEEVIVQEIEKNRLKAEHFVWVQDQNRWIYVKDHPKFSTYFTIRPEKPAEGAKRFYIGKDGARFGPYMEDEIKSGILRGDYLPEHFFWDSADNKWVELGTIADYTTAFKEYEASIEPEEPPPPQIAKPEAEVTSSTLDIPAGPPEIIPDSVPSMEIEVIPQPDKTAPVVLNGPGIRTKPEPTIKPDGQAIELEKPDDDNKPGTLIDIDEPIAEKEFPLSEITTDKPAVIEELRPISAREEVIIDDTEEYEPSKVEWYKRLGAGFIDLFLVTLSYFAVSLVMGIIGRNPFMAGPEQTLNIQIFYGTVAGIIVFYFLVRDSIGGGSLGKRIMGYRIVSARNPHSYGNLFHSIIRNLFVFIPVVNIIDLLMMITNPEGKRMADKLLNTIAMEKIEIDYIRDKQSSFDSLY